MMKSVCFAIAAAAVVLMGAFLLAMRLLQKFLKQQNCRR